MDLANPEADFYSNTAVYNGNTILEEHPYNLVLTPKGGDGPLPIATSPPGWWIKMFESLPARSAK
jgi:hypothetical protein